VGLRDLLVFVDDSRNWRSHLALAADLASRHACKLTAAYAPHWSESQLYQHRTAEAGLVSAAELQGLERQAGVAMAAAAQAVEAELTALGQRTGLSVQWRPLESPASLSLPQEARCADLCMLGHSLDGGADPTSYTLAEKLLFTTGRPVLSVPPNLKSDTLGRHIAVAWNSSRASARSLHDAMPLIEAAERVTVITANPDDYLSRPGAPPIERLTEHLRLHGVDAELVSLRGVSAGAISDTLQAKAQEIGADLLIAGAFGQPRLWERLMGSATRDLLDRMRLPVLMSS
jgi:nucleotide-binding universal stress UspA family protein